MMSALLFQTKRAFLQTIPASEPESSVLTFGGVDHLGVYRSGDDGLGEILQVAAQTITQDREFQLIQVSRGWI